MNPRKEAHRSYSQNQQYTHIQKPFNNHKKAYHTTHKKIVSLLYLQALQSISPSISSNLAIHSHPVKQPAIYPVIASPLSPNTNIQRTCQDFLNTRNVSVYLGYIHPQHFPSSLELHFAALVGCLEGDAFVSGWVAGGFELVIIVLL